MKTIKILFLLLVLASFKNDAIYAQVPSKFIGDWRIYEVTSDRIYINFETDSVFLYETEEQDKMKKTELQNDLKSAFSIFTNFSISIAKDNIITFYMGSDVKEKHKFIYNAKLSELTFGKKEDLESLKINAENLLVYDFSDEYDTKTFTFKKKSK